jgi:hypothetical protein
LSDATDRIVAIKAVADLVQPDVAPTLTTGEVELEVDRAKLASYWAINTAYSLGNVIVVGNGHAYEVVQAGTSQSTLLTANDWPVYAGVVVGDGTSNPQLRWREIGTAQFNPGIFGAEYNVYDINRAAKRCCELKASQSAALVDNGDVSASQIRKHWLEQAARFRPFRRPITLVRC